MEGASVAAQLASLRDEALAGAHPTKRKDEALYALVERVRRFCRHVHLNNLREELADTLRVSGVGLTGRRYVENGASVETVVCRYVFSDNRVAAYRYAICIAEAEERQIGNLCEWLPDNGGLHALYQSRRRKRAAVRTLKRLHLDKPIAYTVGEPLTVRLMPMEDLTFKVLEQGDI